MKIVLKAFLIIFGIGLLFFIIWIIVIISAFGGFDKDYSVTELKEHYIENKNELIEIKNFINSVTPLGKNVHIEFDNDKALGIFHLSTKTETEIERSNNWDLEINSTKTDSLLDELGWTKETLITLKYKLDKAKCISVSNGEPTKIGFQRSGMGMYSFNLFEKPLPKSEYATYNDSCTYILVNNKMVLEYGGGAIGSQCFYNFK